MVGDKLDASNAGNIFTIGNEYAGGSKAVLEFEVREDGFDPASADPLIPSDGS